MDDIIEKLVTSVPAAVVVIVVVKMFLEFLKGERIAAARRDLLFTQTLTTLSADAAETAKACHERHIEATRIIERNAEAWRDAKDAISAISRDR